MRRNKNLHLHLSDLELHKLREIAHGAEMPMSAYLRALLRYEWEKIPLTVRQEMECRHIT